MYNTHEHNLHKFIFDEKAYFESLSTGIIWENSKWDANDWLFHRGGDSSLLFTALSSTQIKSVPAGVTIPPKGPLEAPYSDFVKALAVFVHRTKNIGFMAVRNYINECRRIHIFMHARQENCPTRLTRWHFENVIDFLNNAGYKNLYDTSANLKVISEVIDKKQLTPYPIGFTAVKSQRSYFNYKTQNDHIDDNDRAGEEKIPSYEAMQAYALCTNNPINDNEEILIRTIDLLIAMGQRGNEVALIPFDCWVENTEKDKSGNPVLDGHGQPIIKKGIRYYAEKDFLSRVHWLADQDILFAERAIGRLKILTINIRAVAKWQEQNPEKIWAFAPDEILEDHEIIKYLGFANTYNLYLFLTRNGIKPISKNSKIRRPHAGGKTFAAQFYRARDIEQFMLPKLGDHAALKEKVNGQWKVLLETSEVLSIRFDGAYRFRERSANLFTVFPGRTELREINAALGTIPGMQSVFDRRKLTEADGSKIILTSHQPRHWRNTLYELAGMSNVQQALALGRQRLDQNPVYQHTTLSEKTQSHKEFISFSSPAEKLNFLHSGIKSKAILGEITETYHRLNADQGEEKANIFLKTHALAIHVTPFGGCTHDFSQAPCSKHLQCWNGCSHLHRTHLPGETDRIEEQIRQSEQVLAKMKAEKDGEYGSEKWIQDIEKKIANLRQALQMSPQDSPTPVFPDGIPFTIAEHMKKSSSVKD
jgi:hypothetical protein